MSVQIDFNELGGRKPNFTRPEIIAQRGIPPQMHGTNPRTILGKSWWDKQRAKVYKENNYCCWACGSSESFLEAHERYKYRITKIRKNVVVELLEIVGLCKLCHHFVHPGRLRHLVNKGVYTEQYMSRVLFHGYNLLDRHNILIEIPNKRLLSIPAKKWRIKLGNMRYPMKFETEAKRVAYYEKN